MMKKTFLITAAIILLLSTYNIFSEDCIDFLDNIFKKTAIKEINENPAKLHKEEVLVEGKVLKVVNFFDKIKYYELADGKTSKDKIRVISLKSLPAEDKTYYVKGTINQALKIGEFQFVVIEEICRKEKK